MSGRYAFVTLITSDHYLPGALAVAAALKEVHPTPPVDPEVPFQTVCIVTPETVDVKTIKHLRRAFDSVIGVEVIDEQTTAELHLLGRPDLHSVLTKLHVFRLTQFEKIIFLDADILPIRPLSHLFTLPYEFSAVPDVGWPDIFNSGMMVLSPGEDKFNHIMSLVKNKGSWDGGDQGVLNEWRGNNWNRLSFTYNTTPTAAYTYPPAYERFGSQISALHFIGPNKPWNELPYRAPSSASQNQYQMSQPEQRQTSLPQQAVSASQGQISTPAPSSFASTTAAPLQSYGYNSLVDRWFDVYDRNYRQLVPAAGHDYEARKYENVWDNIAAPSHETGRAPSEGVPGSVLGLEDLRKLATEGGNTATHQKGKGDYLSLPLEGRIDLMRPKREPTREPPAPELHAENEPSQSSLPSEEHVRTPTSEKPQWHGHAFSEQQHLSTPGPNEVPPSPHIAPLQLPPSSSASPAPASQNLPGHQAVGQGYFPSQPHSQPPATNVSTDAPGISSSTSLPAYSEAHLSPTQSGQVQSSHHTSQQGHPTQRYEPPPAEPPRPISPPLLNWNPAIEPPPNVPPTLSTFPSDAYFPNAWDMPPSFSSGKIHDALTGSTSSISSQFFEPPPQAQIPSHLIQEGHYKNVMGLQHEGSPQPDISKVTSVFPWEQKPRHIPGRVFPEGESVPPGVQYIENMPPAEPEPESELLTPEMTQEETEVSPQIQLPSPPVGFPGARGYSNAWDSVPSIQKYAARLAKPSITSPPLSLPSSRIRRRADSYRSRGEQSDANSMDGDVEDEVDDDDSDADAGSRLSGSELSSGGKSRRGSKGSLTSPPSGSVRSRTGKRDYRSYGVQTIPKDVRSIAVQVSQAISTSTGKLSSKNTPKPTSMAFSPVARPHIELPKQPTVQELQLGPEPSALATPSSANVDSFIRPSPGRQQHHGIPTGMLSPRLHDAYTFASPSRTPPNASPGTQTPVARRQVEITKPPALSMDQPQSLTHAVARTSSQETADSPVGPASPMDIPPVVQLKKPAGRKWNPATGVDVFKRGSEEVLARFLRLGSWEDETQAPAHAHG